MHPVHEDRTRVAWIDYLLDSKRLRGAKRGAHRIELFLELASQLFRITRGREIALVRRLDSTLNRQRSPIRRRPRVTQIQPGRDSMARARNAKSLAHHDRNPRRRSLEHRVQRAHAATNRSRHLGFAPDEESRLIDKIDDRQMKRVAEVNEL